MDKYFFKAVMVAGLMVVVLLAVSVTSYASGVGQGSAVYNTYCAGCHGGNGQGTAYGPDIAGESASEVNEVVREGDDEMPGYSSSQISETALADLAAYVGSLSGCASGAVYEQYCDGGGDEEHDESDNHGDDHSDDHHDDGDDRDDDGDDHHDDGQCIAGAALDQYCQGQHDQRPDLKVRVRHAEWKSFADYREGVLTVEYTIENHGGSNAGNVTIINPTSATGGARVLTGMPVAVGDIAVGSAGTMTITYEVPSGARNYRAVIFAKTRTGDGATHYYPTSTD